MLNTLRIFTLLFVVLLASACKSEFEKVRTSGDPQAILAAANGYYEQGKFSKAQVLYEQVVNALRGTSELQEAYFKYANTYFETGQYILSSYYFRNYSETYPASDNRGEAQYMEAMSYVKLSPSYRLDQQYTDKAIIALEQYINTYPTTERLGEINNLLDELRVKQEKKAFEAASLYFDMKQYQAAVQAFERVLQDFPDSDRAEQIRYRIADSYINLADNSVIAKRRERYEKAIEFIEIYLKKYSKGEFARTLRSERNRIRKLLKESTDYVRY